MELNEFAEYARKMTLCGLRFTVYPTTFMLNVHDKNGIVQSYYASKSTAILRKGNEKDAERKVIKDCPFNKYVIACLHPEYVRWEE